MNKTDHYLDFEKPILEVASRVRELLALKEAGQAHDLPVKNVDEEISRLEIEEKRVTRMLYRHLSPWQKVQVARHAARPHAKHYIAGLLTDFVPLAGDRSFADDAAMQAGLGRFNGRPVAVLGTEKGATTNERVKHNFGMPKPEGYRKAKRIMEMADRFHLPLLTFVDTPGAFPGVEAEARGQSEAIACCIETSLRLNVPVIATIIGEGGSGGALALATADRVLMLEHAIYSVISPEGCASILWPDEEAKTTVPTAAEALKITAHDLEKLKIIDATVKEPVGGAHRNPALAVERVGAALQTQLEALEKGKGRFGAAQRRERFLSLGR